VPYTKRWYVGVASLRGGLHGVVDLLQLPGMGGAGAAAGIDRVSSESRLVSLHSALGVNAVLWVDRLLGLRNPSTFTALGARPTDAPSYLARCLIDRDGQTWQELDLQLLAADPEFLAIAA
jgi:twitching motility protein PilI